MLTIILVVGYFLFCVGMAFFLDYRTKKRKLNETAVEYSTGKNQHGVVYGFLADVRQPDQFQLHYWQLICSY